MEKHFNLLIRAGSIYRASKKDLFTSNLFEEQKQRTSEGSENSTLVLNGSDCSPWSFKINLESFRTFRSPVPQTNNW